MPAYLVIDVAITDTDTYERYKPLAHATIGKYGGRYIVRGGKTECLEGDWTPRRLVILEFPDAATARAWWESPEYAAAKSLRHASADTNMVLVEGLV